MSAIHRLLRLGIAAAAVAASACSSAADNRAPDPLSPAAPGIWSLDKVVPSDDLQIDTVLARVAPLRVLVRVDGSPLRGVQVTWTVSGSATATDSTTTGADGVASMNFAFGSKVGAYLVQATLSRRPEVAAVSFSGSATPGHAAALRVVSGSGQSDSATARLHDDFVVQAFDAHGNVTSGATIDWTVAGGGGSVSQGQTTTGNDGTSVTRYTLGRLAGANSVDATLHGGGVKVTFQANATPGNPVKLAMVSGNNQSAEVNHTLASDFVVKAADTYDNPVSGTEIDWSIATGGGTLSAAQVMSGPDGFGATRLTLGTAVAVQSVNAALRSAPNAPAVVFSSTATPPPPQPTLVLVSGNGQAGVISTTLSAPIVVRALDAVGQPLAGKTITFTAPGSVSPPTATTDAQGFAQTIWTLGPTPGIQTIIATAAFTTTVASANVLAGLPPLVFTADPLYAPIPLVSSIGITQFATAAVAPASRSPVTAAVTVTLTHGAHTSVPATVTIAAGSTYGRLQITGVSAGTDTIIASAPGYAPATFIATVGLGTISFYPAQVSVGAKIFADICIAGPNGGETFVAAPTPFSLAMSPNIAIMDYYSLDTNTPVTSVGFPLAGANCMFAYLKGISAGSATLTISSPIYRPITVTISVTP